jgi:hypothetical protein
MKKLIALAVVCGFAFTFVACGGGAKKEEATTPETEAPAATDTTATDTTATDTTAAQ